MEGNTSARMHSRFDLCTLHRAEDEERAHAQLGQRVRDAFESVNSRCAAGRGDEEEERLGHIKELVRNQSGACWHQNDNTR